MGMSVNEYKLGVAARVRLTEGMDGARITAGDSGTVAIERDAHNPPKYLKVTITEDGKTLGKEEVGKSLVSALKSSAEEAKTKRAELQKDMMTYISEEMKHSKRLRYRVTTFRGLSSILPPGTGSHNFKFKQRI